MVRVRLLTQRVVCPDAAVLGDRDPVTGLRTPAHYGRPNFDEIFRRVADLHPEEHVGVFFCGPHSYARPRPLLPCRLPNVRA